MSRKVNLLRDKLIGSVLKFQTDSNPTKRWTTKSTVEEVAQKMTPKGQKEKGQRRMNKAAYMANEIVKQYVR